MGQLLIVFLSWFIPDMMWMSKIEHRYLHIAVEARLDAYLLRINAAC